MDIGQALLLAMTKLKQVEIKNPHLMAEILLSFILKKPREWILSHPEGNLSKQQLSTFNFQLSKLSKGSPLAYITGEKEFYGLTFKVNKNVLIPRPETEMMVDYVVDRRSEIGDRKTVFIDVGTGSGCIIISILKTLQQAKFPISPRHGSGQANFQFFATDISRSALTVARQNAKIHKVLKLINFSQGNLLTPIINDPRFPLSDSRLIIFANLPYLTPADVKHSPTIQKEPKIALTAGPDGLKYYRQLLVQIKKLSANPDFRSSICLLLEIDPSQVKKIRQIAKNLLPAFKFKITKDLCGKERNIILKY